MAKKKNFILGISGASGATFGVRLLENLSRRPIKVHVILTAAGEDVLFTETGLSRKDLETRGGIVHDDTCLSAPPASGSFPAMGMIVAPCSIRSLSDIAHCNAARLLTRAADVTLKERRPLVLMVRETPLHTGHLELMTKASRWGAVIAPPVPAFYTLPESLDDIITQTVGRTLSLFGLESEIKRWKDQSSPT